MPQNGQTHSNNSSAICWRFGWVCLTILWNWRLKGKDKFSNQSWNSFKVNKKRVLKDIYENLLVLFSYQRRISLREKCLSSEFFWSECRKIRTRKTANTDTFHAAFRTLSKINNETFCRKLRALSRYFRQKKLWHERCLIMS